MKVRELQEQLSKLDPEFEVIGYTEDSPLVPAGHGFRLLDINAVNTTEGKRFRTGDGTPSLKLGREAGSEVLVILEVTGDFWTIASAIGRGFGKCGSEA
jgi:hypothetical protein